MDRKRERSRKDNQVDSALKIWFSKVREKNAPVNGPIMCQMAEELAKTMRKEDFVATDGWFYRWKRRENIVFKRLHGEAKSADFLADNELIKTEWPKIIAEYSPQDIYNADETVLYSRAIYLIWFNFMAYVAFSSINTVIYCIPAGWLWGSHGFLFKLGVVDIAGSCGVHLCGGVSALVSAYMVGPRLGRYDFSTEPLPMGSPTNVILGMFMLWWGWLGFNCGSTYGIDNNKWQYAAVAAVMTLQASIGGGLTGMAISWFKNRRLEIGDVVNSVLGALVSVTAGCALFTTWEALIVGMVGGSISVLCMPLFDKLHIDDPVGATTVHGLCGVWAMIAIGLFVKADRLLGLTGGYSGVFRGGGFHLLGVQLLACVCIITWSAILTFLLLKAIDKFLIPIRMSEWEELVGADFAEHGFRRRSVGISRAVSVLGYIHEDYEHIPVHGDNPCHQSVLERVRNLDSRRASTISKAVAQVTKIALTNKIGKFAGNKNLSSSRSRKPNDVDPKYDTNLSPIEIISNGWT